MPRSFQRPSSEVLASVREVYERGQTIDALRAAEAFAPLGKWGGTEGCCLAARLAANAGAPRLSTVLMVRAWRLDPASPEAQLHYGLELAARRGPLALWLAWREWPTPREPTSKQEAELLALRGTCAAQLRDFQAAEEWMERAEALAPADAWVRLQRAHLLEQQDKVEEALEVAEAASGLHPRPCYRPGVQMCARLLQLLDQDERAIRLLRQANAALQSGPVAAQLYGLLLEHGRWEEARSALERLADLSPLMEPPLRQWLSSHRCRVAYQLGDRAGAAAMAAELEDDFHKAFARQLAAEPADPERVQLDISFVRQHFKTCAPATLAALGRFWRMPGEHLKLAEAMCYDGTPHWRQRQWAEQNGWHVRQFRVTYESAVALLSRGLPFAMSTVEATSAHMQAVAGFDRARGTLLLRDPGQPYIVEVCAEAFLKCFRPFGPLGMLFVPVAERGRIDGLELPDSDAWEDYHRICLALADHDREAAAAVLADLEKRFPDHELVWEARLELASYDANSVEQVRCLDQLLKRFPNNATRQLRRLAATREAPREERIRYLKEACGSKDADPALFIELARALLGDARFLPEARYWLKRASGARPMDPNAIHVRADLAWNDGKLDEATELYRFSASLEGFREGLYQAWFLACRGTRRTEQALAHLQDRCTRFGARSEQPALTLAWALRELEQPSRAREVLSEAVRLRPGDGSLLLQSATLLARLREDVEAARLLAAARGKVRESDWLRAAAEISEHRLEPATTLHHCREILRLEPLALDAHAGSARALARLEGTAAVLDHLRSACARFPHQCALQRMYLDWSRLQGPAAVETAAREWLRAEPSDAWARRELAMALAKQRRFDEALREAVDAAQIEPRNSCSFSVLGHVCRERQELAEARAHFRTAVELSVDDGYALQGLVELARTDAERRAELEFIERELVRQVVQGEGLLSFLHQARPVLKPEALLKTLRQAHKERPDLWHAWSALISQAGHMGQLDLASELAQEAVRRFPHLPRLRLDLAAVHQWRKELPEEIAAAEQAFEMNPGFTQAALALTDALARSGRLHEACRVFERALVHSPEDVPLRASYAHLLWRQQRPEEAFSSMEDALRRAPDFSAAWGFLVDWADRCGAPERPATFARSLAAERPGETRTWLMLARVLTGSATIPERIAAVDKALALEPPLTEAWDLKAELLVEAERFDDAVGVCQEGITACVTEVHTLKGRQAWVEACRRRLPEAIELMRQVLAENAGYAWGWHQLASWLMEQDVTEEAAAALEQLLRLRPHEAWVHRQLGLLRLKSGSCDAAQEAFSTALDLEPADTLAAGNLFDLQVKAGCLQEAGATLRLMELHQPGARTQACQALLHLRSSDWAAADEAFASLCAMVDPDPWPVEVVAEAYVPGGRAKRAVKILRRAVASAACHPQAAAALIRLLLHQREAFSAVCQFLRLKPGPMQVRAAAPLARGLAERNRRLLFRFVLRRRRAVFASDDAAWGEVGFALVSANRMRAVAEWLADWTQRREVQPWMLFNLCLALRHLGRYEEANALARQVLDTLGHREGAADMRLFLAVEAALSGDIPGARQHLDKMVIREDVPHDDQLATLARTLVEFLQCPAAGRAAAFRELSGRLDAKFPAWTTLRSMKDIRRTLRRAGNLFVREGAGWRARLWFGWKLNWQWLVVPLPALLPVAFGGAPRPGLVAGLLIWILIRFRR